MVWYGYGMVIGNGMVICGCTWVYGYGCGYAVMVIVIVVVWLSCIISLYYSYNSLFPPLISSS
jgi:hypothetical protein